MMKYPDIKTAINIWHESLTGVVSHAKPQQVREYIYHTTGVAEAAAKIAAKCGMNEEKAYVIGLLHDYGKIQNEKITGKSHFIVGYEKLKKDGWIEAAKICLNHSFPDPDFSLKDYSGYNKNDLILAKKLIAETDYDDYDRLIQLCDILFEATSAVSYQRRLACIRKRYNLKPEQTKNLEIKAAENKAHFDAKCGCDIYKLLNIEE